MDELKASALSAEKNIKGANARQTWVCKLIQDMAGTYYHVG